MIVPISISQFRPAKADPSASLDGIEAVFGRVAGRRPPPRVLVFPETALTGYFLEDAVREHALPADRLFRELRRRWARAGDPDRALQIAIGFYELHESRVYNSALYAELGGPAPRILHVHRKVFLPTYGLFQEQRFVEAGSSFRVFDAGWGRAAVLVCEDAFHSISATLAALDGADAIFVLSAAPARGVGSDTGRPASVERWDRVIRATAEEHGVFAAAAQLVGFDAGKGFPGGSVAYGPRGDPLARADLWEPELLATVLDLDDLLPARADEPLLADLEAVLPRILGAGADRTDRPAAAGAPDSEAAGAGPVPEGRESPAAPKAGDLPPSPEGPGPRPDPDDLSPLEVNAELVAEWLVHFLRGEVRDKRGFERVVVGLSGGIDSSVTASLCARALGSGAVRAYYLPSGTSSPESREHAAREAERLGIELETIDIGGAVRGFVEALGKEPGDHRLGNVMSRLRMIALFDQSARHRGVPIGTGNKSERLLGYFTWNADDTPPINPIGDLFKTQVRELARALGTPDFILEKPATAELVRGQTDEEDLGISYPEADLILHHLLGGYTPERLVRYGFETENVRIVTERLHSTHYKRHLPTVALVSSTAVGEGYLRPVDYSPRPYDPSRADPSRGDPGRGEGSA